MLALIICPLYLTTSSNVTLEFIRRAFQIQDFPRDSSSYFLEKVQLKPNQLLYSNCDQAIATNAT